MALEVVAKVLRIVSHLGEPRARKHPVHNMGRGDKVSPPGPREVRLEQAADRDNPMLPQLVSCSCALQLQTG